MILHTSNQSNQRHSISQCMVTFEDDYWLSLWEVFNSEDFIEQSILVERCCFFVSQKINECLLSLELCSICINLHFDKCIFDCLQKMIGIKFFQVIRIKNLNEARSQSSVLQHPVLEVSQYFVIKLVEIEDSSDYTFICGSVIQEQLIKCSYMS